MSTWSFSTPVHRKGRERTYLRSNNPSNSPARKPEALSKAIYDQYVVLIHILDVLSRGNRRPIAVRSVIVATVELIHDEGGAVTADILDLCELGVLDDFAGRVARVRGQDNGRAASDLLCDFVGVDVVAISLCEG